VVLRDQRSKPIGVSVLREYAEAVNNTSVRHVLLLVNKPLTAHAFKDTQGSGSDPEISKIQWEIPPLGNMLYACVEGKKHKVLTEEEIKEREAQPHLKSRQRWAKMELTDPVAMYYGCKKGDVVEFTLGGTQGIQPELRICI
jgi:DNA-directed RNA polymerase subunit H (RpoH/RPB5)